MRHSIVFAGFLVVACGGSTPASELAKAPEFDPAGQTKCSITKSQMEPLIVEWPSAARGKLESASRRGVVPVRYVGCEMEVLSSCRGPGQYQYVPITPKRDTVRIRNEDELYAAVPVYAASLEGKLQSAGELNVHMTIVGRHEASDASVSKEELEGDCAAATHVITALTVGAFDFFAGAAAEVGGGVKVGGFGAGASDKAARETLSQDGDVEQCRSARADDKNPPFECGAPIRLELAPLAEASAPPAAPPAAQAPPPQATMAPAPAPQVAMPSTCYEGQIGPCTAACNQGVATGCAKLGITYAAGISVKRDMARGVPYLKKGCDGGSGEACNMLGNLYETGQGGLATDRKKAITLYDRACEYRDVAACNVLAQRYEMGTTVARNVKKALTAYRRGCEMYGRSDPRSMLACVQVDRLEAAH